MEIDNNFKKIIKHYLKAKDNEHNQEKYLRHLEKVIILLGQQNLTDIQINNQYIENIKKYTYTNVT